MRTRLRVPDSRERQGVTVTCLTPRVTVAGERLALDGAKEITRFGGGRVALAAHAGG